MWPLREGGRARASVGGRGSFVLILSLSLRGGWWAHVALEVCVGLRGEEEFHDFGVTVARGHHERREPKLKERTEREGAQRRGGSQQEHTHDEGERGEGKRETEARWDYMGGSRCP